MGHETLGEIALQNRPHVAAGSFVHVLSTEAGDCLGDPSLSHCKNNWNKEWVNLMKASDTSLELCLLWKSSPTLLKLCLHNFFLSSLLQHLLSILFETDINCPLSIPFTTFPCLLFLARSYGTLLIPKFCGHRREGIISIHVTGSRVVWAVVLKFFRFSTFPWSIHFNCVLSYSLFPKWNCSFNLQCIVSTPWFNTRSFNLQVLCICFLQFLAFLTIFSKKNHHPYWGLLEGHSLPWGKQMHHQIYSEWVSCA